MLANIVVQFFIKGGPVMWPILICALVAVAVVGERTFWWLRESRRRDPQKLEQLLAALENADVAAALKFPKARRTGHPHDPSRAESCRHYLRCRARCNWRRASN